MNAASSFPSGLEARSHPQSDLKLECPHLCLLPWPQEGAPAQGRPARDLTTESGAPFPEAGFTLGVLQA